jgi:hypothetical protein
MLRKAIEAANEGIAATHCERVSMPTPSHSKARSLEC